MARIKYRDYDFRSDSAERILQMNQILGEYNGRVSVRQLYYRLVAGGLISNNLKEYGKVQDLITKARYAGLIDWDAIEDRNREPYKHADWHDAASLLSSAAASFRLDRWHGQRFYVELHCEKAALAGILAPIADDYHVTLMVNRGYSSASAMKESADRICNVAWNSNHAVILYIGDHDPSGNDMVRDIRERLIEFGCSSSLDVRKVALTMEQVEEYDPPPNPAKLSDTRAEKYIEEFGDSSWEVDALPPKVLDKMIRKMLNSYIDRGKMDSVISKENEIKQRIKQVAATFVERK